MSDHDHRLLADVKATGRARRNRRVALIAGVVAGVFLVSAIGVASLDDDRPQRVRIAAPGSEDDIDEASRPTTTTTGLGVEPTSTTALERATTTTAASPPAVPDRPKEATTTTQPPSTAISANHRHEPSGLVFTLTSSRNQFRTSDQATFELVVRNESGVPRTYNSSPGPRFAFVRDGQQVWHDGCETAYPAIFGTDEIAPGEEVRFTGAYPQTSPDGQPRESCQQPPGDYNLTGLFQWCPQGGEECEDIPLTPVPIEIIP